jgi:hypothetical protein
MPIGFEAMMAKKPATSMLMIDVMAEAIAKADAATHGPMLLDTDN